MMTEVTMAELTVALNADTERYRALCSELSTLIKRAGVDNLPEGLRQRIQEAADDPESLFTMEHDAKDGDRLDSIVVKVEPTEVLTSLIADLRAHVGADG